MCSLHTVVTLIACINCWSRSAHTFSWFLSEWWNIWLSQQMSLYPGQSSKKLVFTDKSCINCCHCVVACLIKPKSQMGIGYPPNLVQILILLGFAKTIKFLSVREVRANLTSCLVEKYKGFEKFIMRNFFRFVFRFLQM